MLINLEFALPQKLRLDHKQEIKNALQNFVNFFFPAVLSITMTLKTKNIIKGNWVKRNQQQFNFLFWNGEVTHQSPYVGCWLELFREFIVKFN